MQRAAPGRRLGLELEERREKKQGAKAPVYPVHYVRADELEVIEIQD